MPKDLSIANMSGPELVQYLNTLSMRQSEFSKLKIQLIEDLKPLERARADKRADILKITESLKQTKVEIAACKYAIKGEQQ